MRVVYNRALSNSAVSNSVVSKCAVSNSVVSNSVVSNVWYQSVSYQKRNFVMMPCNAFFPCCTWPWVSCKSDAGDRCAEGNSLRE